MKSEKFTGLIERSEDSSGRRDNPAVLAYDTEGMGQSPYPNEKCKWVIRAYDSIRMKPWRYTHFMFLPDDPE